MAPKVKPAKNSKLPKLPENYFEPVGKGGWPPISTWIKVSLLPLEALLRHSLLVIRFLLGGNTIPGGKLNLEVKPKLGHHPHLEDNPRLEDIIHHMDKISLDH